MTSAESLAYGVPTGIEFLSVRWDQETVLFDPRSGDTHLLNAMAAAALSALQRGPTDAYELTQHLAGSFEESADDSLASGVEELIAQLVELGLIEPCDR